MSATFRDEISCGDQSYQTSVLGGSGPQSALRTDSWKIWPYRSESSTCAHISRRVVSSTGARMAEAVHNDMSMSPVEGSNGDNIRTQLTTSDLDGACPSNRRDVPEHTHNGQSGENGRHGRRDGRENVAFL